ncbi:FAD:protein FMN transferase [Kiritimatiellota bacterium B12222]|nr:FAD:protein FMN transferase [Kiritimatiellota bacterium B12222]
MEKKNTILIGTLLVLMACGVWILQTPRAGARAEQVQVSFGGETMGTTYQVQLAQVSLAAEELQALEVKVALELLAVNQAMSTYMPESEISRFNRGGTEPFQVSLRFQEVLRRSFEIYEQTHEAFDPTLGPLINLWGFGEAGSMGVAPSAEAIASVMKEVGMSMLTLSGDELTKNEAGIEINLSAIAKGYGVDRVAGVLKAEGFDNIYVEIGGELYCEGVNGAGMPWRIGIQVPAMNAQEKAMQVISLENRGLATSGDYRNYVVDDAGLRHHILDPRTGYPAKHTLASVSVLAEDCMTADAVATALFVMGTEEGWAWLEGQEGLEALFIDRDGDSYRNTATPGFEDVMIAVP